MNTKDYNIYAGLSGGFGGANYIGTLRDSNLEEAEKYAYEAACEEYDSYAGSHGLRTVDEIMEDETLDERDAYETYLQEMEDWIECYVIPTDEDDLEEKIIEL